MINENYWSNESFGKNPKTDALKIYTSTLYILTLAFICSTQFSQLSYVTDKDYFFGNR